MTRVVVSQALVASRISPATGRRGRLRVLPSQSKIIKRSSIPRQSFAFKPVAECRDRAPENKSCE